MAEPVSLEARILHEILDENYDQARILVVDMYPTEILILRRAGTWLQDICSSALRRGAHLAPGGGGEERVDSEEDAPFGPAVGNEWDAPEGGAPR